MFQFFFPFFFLKTQCLLYGAHVSTTVLAILAELLNYRDKLEPWQFAILVGVYSNYLLNPLLLIARVTIFSEKSSEKKDQ
ncbi:hypothetical protein HK096_007872 [Nowakowskiella sp. JEL0078]|nr:hypothetical protein HK096_007872 [Nowakowskiella sp. JEL0078]